MTDPLSTLIAVLMKAGLAALIFNEVRGFVMAAPVIYGVYLAGGTYTAVLIGLSSLGGIALSVLVPIVVAQRLKAARTPQTA